MSNSRTIVASQLTTLQRRRLSWSIAKGRSVAKTAECTGLTTPDVSELVADSGFSGLVDAYRRMLAMPENERHEELVDIATMVLRDAIVRGDRRAALFILKQRDRKLCPAEVLARGVIKSLEREVKAVPPRSRSPQVDQARPVLREMSCPIDNATNKAACDLRAEIFEEIEKRAHFQPMLPRKRKKPSLSIDDLSSRQVSIIMKAYQESFSPGGVLPETTPKKPNAP